MHDQRKLLSCVFYHLFAEIPEQATVGKNLSTAGKGTLVQAIRGKESPLLKGITVFVVYG
jgi:hypothetical protein